MSLEKNIERIAEALEKLAEGSSLGAIAKALENLTIAGASQATTAPTKPASTGSQRQAKNVAREDKVKDEPKADEPKADEPKADEPADDDLGLDDPVEEQAEEFKEDDVRKALKNYRDINGMDALMKVLKEEGHGATGMGSLKPEHYAAVMKVAR